MVPYFVFLFFPLFLSGIVHNKRRYMFIMAIVLSAFLALRSLSVGGDLSGYYLYFNHLYVSGSSLEYTLALKEPLFYLLNKVCGILSHGDFRFYLSVCAVVFSFGLSYVVYKLSDCQWMSWYLITAFSTLVYGLSGIRSSFGLIFGLIGATYLLDKNTDTYSIRKYIIFCIIASLFHFTSIIYLAILPLLSLRRNKIKTYSLLLISSGFVLILFGDRIFPFLNRLFFPTKEYSFTSTGGYGLLTIVGVIWVGIQFLV